MMNFALDIVYITLNHCSDKGLFSEKTVAENRARRHNIRVRYDNED